MPRFLKGAARLSPSLSELAFEFLRHSYDGEHFTVSQRDVQIFQGGVAVGAIERDAGESGAHFEAGETGGAGGALAGF